MDSPLSPVIVEIVMQDLENKTLERFEIDLPFYIRYIDDVATAALMDYPIT